MHLRSVRLNTIQPAWSRDRVHPPHTPKVACSLATQCWWIGVVLAAAYRPSPANLHFYSCRIRPSTFHASAHLQPTTSLHRCQWPTSRSQCPMSNPIGEYELWQHRCPTAISHPKCESPDTVIRMTTTGARGNFFHSNVSSGIVDFRVGHKSGLVT